MPLSPCFPLLVLLAFGACTPGQGSRAQEVSAAAVATAPSPGEAPLDTLPDESLAWLPEGHAARVAVLTGRLDPARDTGFELLADDYTDADGAYYVRRSTAAALTAMLDAARGDGVRLRVRSATRNFDRQSEIWGAKWRGERLLEGGVNLATSGLSDSGKARLILLYSSMPGTSRHHWGTDVDLNSFENDYFASGRGAEEYGWLVAHAADYGFYQPYTPKGSGRTGYEEERWHWSYRPLARPLAALYRAEVDYDDIDGFEGSSVAPRVGAIEDYVFGLPAYLQPAPPR